MKNVVFLFVVGMVAFGGGVRTTEARTTFLSGTLPAAYVGAPSTYDLAVAPSAGPGSYTWTWYSTGSSGIPAGFVMDTMSADGVAHMYGTPTLSGVYAFTVRGTDAFGRVYAADFGLTVYGASHTVLPEAVPMAYVGSFVNQSFSLATTYGTMIPAARWQMSGDLPPGLNFDTIAGTLSGTPTSAGVYTFTVKGMVTEGASQFGVRGYTMTVSGGSLAAVTVSPGMPFSEGVVGQTYPVSFLSATGGTGSYSWTLSSGTVPPGLVLNTNGSLSGVPSFAGTYAFVVQVRDSIGATAIAGYAITIRPWGSSPTYPVYPTYPIYPIYPTYPVYPSYPSVIVDGERDQRLTYLQNIGISVHALVKLPDDGLSSAQEDTAVYYIGTDGRRHAFPHSRVFLTWYTDFSGVRVISPSNLAGIPLGSNVTYKPGVRMVKFQTNPKVYVVGPYRTLRWVTSSAIASALYGPSWSLQVDDVSDASFADYRFGSDILGVYDFDPVSTRNAVTYPSDAL